MMGVGVIVGLADEKGIEVGRRIARRGFHQWQMRIIEAGIERAVRAAWTVPK